MTAQYPLKGTESPEFVAFLQRLLNPDENTRCTAAEALADPWVLGTDWTADLVAEKLAALDTSSATVPGNYRTRQEWLAQVAILTGVSEGGGEDDDEEDAF